MEQGVRNKIGPKARKSPVSKEKKTEKPNKKREDEKGLDAGRARAAWGTRAIQKTRGAGAKNVVAWARAKGKRAPGKRPTAVGFGISWAEGGKRGREEKATEYEEGRKRKEKKGRRKKEKKTSHGREGGRRNRGKAERPARGWESEKKPEAWKARREAVTERKSPPSWRREHNSQP